MGSGTGVCVAGAVGTGVVSVWAASAGAGDALKVVRERQAHSASAKIKNGNRIFRNFIASSLAETVDVFKAKAPPRRCALIKQPGSVL